MQNTAFLIVAAFAAAAALVHGALRAAGGHPDGALSAGLGGLALAALLPLLAARLRRARTAAAAPPVEGPSRAGPELTEKLKMLDGELLENANDMNKRILKISASLQDSFSRITKRQNALGGSTVHIKQIIEAIGRIDAMAGELSKRLDSSSQAVVQAGRSIAHTAALAREADGIASSLDQTSREGTASLTGLAESSLTMRSVSEEVAGIALMIRDISDQTNVLAMNAAIQAAHAGAAGKGFAVLAQEVRRLSEQTGKRSEEIQRRVRTIVETVRVNQELADKAMRLFGTVNRDVGRVRELNGRISAAAEAEEAAGNSISGSIRDMQAFQGTLSEALADQVKKSAAVSGVLDELIAQGRETVRRSSEDRGAMQSAAAGVDAAVGLALELGEVAALAEAPARPAARSSGDLVLGFNQDISTGSSRELGLSSMHGFLAAVEELNQSGGIAGRRIEPVVLDERTDADLSERNVRELLERGAAAVIGSTYSSTALRWIHLAQARELVVICPTATSTALTRRYGGRPDNWIFRVSPPDLDQARLMVRHCAAAAAPEKVAVLHETTPYGMQGANDSIAVLFNLGSAPAAVQSFDPEAAELDAAVAAVKDSGAEAVVLNCLAKSTVKLLKAFERLKYRPVLAGTWTNMAGTLWKDCGALAGGLVFPVAALADSSQRSRALAEKIRQRHGQTPIFPAAAQAYDAVMLLAAAAAKAGGAGGPAVRAALEALDEVQGVIRVYRSPFSRENHEALGEKDCFLARWENGRVVPARAP